MQGMNVVLLQVGLHKKPSMLINCCSAVISPDLVSSLFGFGLDAKLNSSLF